MSEPSNPAALPGSEIDFRDAQAVADVLLNAAKAHLSHPRLKGSVVVLKQKMRGSNNIGRVVMTGDLHDHGQNLMRILKYANPAKRRDDYLILHEVIHGENITNDVDLSVRMLVRTAALKLMYPEQVLMLQSNHELAQRNGEGILKASGNQIKQFDEGLDYLFGNDSEVVRQAVNKYVASLPLAVLLPNGVMCCHSLPSPRKMDAFDARVLTRRCSDEDLASKGSAHLMVWGRRHSAEQGLKLGKMWGVKQFVMGHQKAEMGYEEEGDNMLILASNHDHGVLLPIELDKTYDQEALVGAVVRLGGVLLD
ncbi:metallophosphoesterase [Poriferisphaera sp. WC338]|uniref:metallophosphoesterase n=1 Tax=Poriferisphaera sp. WC338 TaxID=3425129 RepID=UPI003D812D13